MPDLTTIQYVQSALAGGGLVLSPVQNTAVTQLIPAASRLIRKHCNRYFNRTIFDGLYTVESPSKFILTREYPLNAVLRVSTTPTVVLSVNNTDTTTNQRAYVALVQDPAGVADVADLPAPTTGVKLVRIHSGIAAATTINFKGTGNVLDPPELQNDHKTVESVVTAINALGAGWVASVTDGYALWPTVDPEYANLCYFHPLQGSVPALGLQSNGLVMHVDDIYVQVRADTGDICLAPSNANDPFNSLKFGGYLSTDMDSVSDFGGYQGLRVIYDAGMDTVFEDVQQAVVDTVAYWLNLAGLDQTITEETVGAYSYKLSQDNLLRYGLPASATSKLSYYRNNRC